MVNETHKKPDDTVNPEIQQRKLDIVQSAGVNWSEHVTVIQAGRDVIYSPEKLKILSPEEKESLIKNYLEFIKDKFNTHPAQDLSYMNLMQN